MLRSVYASAPLALSLACAHAGPAGEEVLDRHGELGAIEHPERAAVTVTADTITVWGVTEVPDGSRLQTALAGVDAIARAELLTAVEVRVASMTTDIESDDPRRRSLTEETLTAVHGVLDRAGPLPHGWQRVRRGNENVIRLWARLEVPRATLERAVRSVLGAEGLGDGGLASLLEGLSLPDAGPGGAAR